MSLGNVVIFGDSYSTFEDNIPKGYPTYYSKTNHPESCVNDKTLTWWHQVITETNSNLVLNNSWSGSTICYTGYDNVDNSETSSFICRFNKLKESGFFQKNKIDTVLVFGGTNDSWCGAPIGELEYSCWKKEDLYSVLPAVAYFLNILRNELPSANIVFIINTGLKPEVTEGIKNACVQYGIKYIQLENIDKFDGHPTAKGMREIKDSILKSLNF